MNILLGNLTYKPHIGGIENSFRHISDVFKKQGHEVIIVCSDLSPERDKRLCDIEIENGIKIYRYKRYHPKFLLLKPLLNISDIIKSYLLVRKLDNKYKFDFSIVRNMRVGLGVNLALKKKPVIYVLSSITKYLDNKKLNLYKGNFFAKFLKWFYHNRIIIGQDIFFEKALIRRSSLNVVFSENMLSQINQLVNINNNIKIIRPGVDSTRFRKNAHKNSFLKNNHKEFIFILLGRLISVKGADVAIKAFSKLNIPNTKLYIVGDGPEKNKLINLTKKLEIEKKVSFFSKTSTPEYFFSISHAFLMTSTYESFGQTILEAMSSELPVIGFKSDSINCRTATEEVIDNSINGFLCNYGIENLTTAMKKIATLSINERQKMGEQNRKKIIDTFSWEYFCNSIMETESIRNIQK